MSQSVAETMQRMKFQFSFVTKCQGWEVCGGVLTLYITKPYTGRQYYLLAEVGIGIFFWPCFPVLVEIPRSHAQTQVHQAA